jgi:hypothetical protein
MTVYYNILNILGDRMQKKSKCYFGRFIRTRTSRDGLAMSESIKTYLVDVFAINPSRITTKVNLTKYSIRTTRWNTELDFFVKETVEYLSKVILHLYGISKWYWCSIETSKIDKSSSSSYVTFNNKGAGEALSTWSLQITDEQGKSQSFGPYTEDEVRIPGKAILGSPFQSKMIGQTKSGVVVENEAPVHVVLWTPAKTEEGLRYSIIYEFNKSKAITSMKNI